MLEVTDGTKVSTSSVKRVRYQHNLKGCSPRRKPLLQNRHKKVRLKFANEHCDKDLIFWRNILRSDETKIELSGRRVRLVTQRTCMSRLHIQYVLSQMCISTLHEILCDEVWFMAVSVYCLRPRINQHFFS